MSLLPTGPPVLLPPAGSPLISGHLANSGSGNTSTSTSVCMCVCVCVHVHVHTCATGQVHFCYPSILSTTIPLQRCVWPYRHSTAEHLHQQGTRCCASESTLHSLATRLPSTQCTRPLHSDRLSIGHTMFGEKLIGEVTNPLPASQTCLLLQHVF